MTSNKTISRFSGRHAFLSNFAYSRIEWEGITYPTVEHAFQASKTHDANERARIAALRSAAAAKSAGRSLQLRADWDDVRVPVMAALLRLKFAIPDMRAALIATGDADLIEGNTWGDRFWGVVDGVGENWLGRSLMSVRADISSSGD